MLDAAHQISNYSRHTATFSSGVTSDQILDNLLLNDAELIAVVYSQSLIYTSFHLKNFEHVV